VGAGEVGCAGDGFGDGRGDGPGEEPLLMTEMSAQFQNSSLKRAELQTVLSAVAHDCRTCGAHFSTSLQPFACKSLK